MAQRTCSIGDCTKPAQARGWCPTHYSRWRVHGDPAVCDRTYATHCSVAGCNGPHASKGLCQRHYDRWRKLGDPLRAGKADRTPLDRFREKYVVQPDGCWSWTASLEHGGYARFTVDRKAVLAHRWSYETFVAEIPADMQLDHLCHSLDAQCAGGASCPHRRCVNPGHLEPVAAAVNTLRGRTLAAANAAKTRCANGHEFTKENTYERLSKAGRTCRRCARNAARRKRMAPGSGSQSGE